MSETSSLSVSYDESGGDHDFQTIGEVAKALDVPQHVIRFWETKFKQIKPVKRKGGHRYFRKEDVEFLSTIKTLLYEKGFTIKGAQKYLDERPSSESQPQLQEQEKTPEDISQQDLFAERITSLDLIIPPGAGLNDRMELRKVHNHLLYLRELLKNS